MPRTLRLAALIALAIAAFPALAGATSMTTDDFDSQTCARFVAEATDSPVSVRCSTVVERPGTGAFVSGSAGATVRVNNQPVFSFDQPVGRTGGAFDGNPEPATSTDDATILEEGVVCQQQLGCTPKVEGPTSAEVRVLPGGSATSVATAGGGGTLEVGETCIRTSGNCGGSGGQAEVGRVAFTRE